jgi:hypothetical protein
MYEQEMKKSDLKRALDARDFHAISAYAASKPRALSVLYSMTFSSDPLMVWRAVEATGIAAAVKARSSLEHVRDFLRRCIWLMNDESGGVGWHSPEVMGEVLFQVPVLIPEFGELLFHYFTESPFERGAVAAVCRLARLAPDQISSHRDRLMEMVDNPDALVRACAVIAIRDSGETLPEEARERLLRDERTVSIYNRDTGRFQLISLRDL